MFGDFLGALLFLLNPSPPPTPGPSQPGNGPQTAEEAAEYERQFNDCAGTWDPQGCRADLYRRYYG